MEQSPSSHVPLSDKDVFLTELRAVTTPSHKRLEELPLSAAIVSPAITLQQYALYLSKMHAFVAAFEKELFPLLDTVFPDINTRKKTGWLTADLQTLRSMGVTVPELPLFEFNAGISEEHLAGMMYVLEGSTLGGKFIYKNISEALSLSPEHGAAYFNGYGAGTGSQWKNLIEELCGYATNKNKYDIFKGADAAFKLLFDHLSR